MMIRSPVFLIPKAKAVAICLVVAIILTLSYGSFYLAGQDRTDRYEIHVVIDGVNFGRYDQMVLLGQNLLAHLPYSFSLISPYKSSLAPSVNPFDTPKSLLSLPSSSGTPDDSAGWLFLERSSMDHRSLYSWLKDQSEVLQNPRQIDLRLVKLAKTKSLGLALNKQALNKQAPHKAHELHSAVNSIVSTTVIDTISLYASTPLMWSLESQETTRSHYHEHVYISFQTLSQSGLSDSINSQLPNSGEAQSSANP